MHAYNDEKKNIVLEHSLKIPGVSQGLQDMIQIYVVIATDLCPDFYILPLSKLILQLRTTSNSILRVIRLLYSKPEADNYRFAIYHMHYKEKPDLQNPHMTISLERCVKQ